MDSDSLLKQIRAVNLDAEFEINAEENSQLKLGVERSVFTGGERVNVSRAAIHCICKKKSAIFLTSLRGKESLADGMQKAYKMAKNAGSTDTQRAFSKKQPPAGKNPLSKKEAMLKESSIVQKIMDGVKVADSSKHVYSTSAFFSSTINHIYGANSLGIACDWAGSCANFSAEIVAKLGAERSSFSEEAEAVDSSDIDFVTVARKAAEMAGRMLGAKQAPTFRGQLLIDAEVAGMIMSFLIGAMSGEEILKGRSFLGGKKGAKIASKAIRLREETNASGSPYNRSFDDDLMPTLSKDLISDGILKTYLHNLYSSEKMKEPDTGNCFYSPSGSIDTTNVVLKEGRGTAEDLMQKVKRGIYLIDTGDSPNMVTGDLSAMVLNGYYVKDGMTVYPVKETMFGINLLDLMKKVSAIGSDTVKLDGMAVPSILVDDVQISGKKN